MRLTQPKFQREFTVQGSDLVSKVQYDPRTNILDATLHTGERYRYRHITSVAFTQFITARSPGKAFNQWVKRDRMGDERTATKLPRK